MDATCMYMCFLPASQTNTHALARINTYVSSRVLAWPQGPKPNATMVQYTSTVHMITPLTHTHTRVHKYIYERTCVCMPTHTKTKHTYGPIHTYITYTHPPQTHTHTHTH